MIAWRVSHAGTGSNRDIHVRNRQRARHLMPLDRHGFLEECYFLFSYSPIRDESGEVGGVLVTVTETTTRVLSERRLRTLRDLAGRAADAKSVALACESAMHVLAENRADIPFAMLYLMEGEESLSLAGTAGMEGGTAAAPMTVDLTASDDTQWPLAAVARSAQAAISRGGSSLISPAWARAMYLL